MKTKILKSLALGLVQITLLCTVACGKKAQDDTSSATSLSVDPVEASIESGITVVSGMADDQAGSSYAQLTSKIQPSIWQTMLGKQAFADTCARAYWQTCNSGVKEADYAGCTVAGTARTITGSVQLSYSHASCTLTTDGDSVTRTYDLAISGPRGGEVAHQSTVKADYRGTSYGGGGKLTKTSSGWDMEILGRHSQMTFRDKSVFDVSVRTLSPLQVSGGLARGSRMLNGGQLEVNHNLSKFTAVITPSNLQWSAGCCHPTAGSLSVTYSGSKTGTATVTFQGCGTGVVDQGGQQQQIELSYCD